MSRANQVTFYDLMRLQSIKRWTIIETARPQSVAEHSFNVLWITLALLEKAQMANSVQSEVLLAILLHDASEALTGDMPTPAKAIVREYGDADIWKRIEHTIAPRSVCGVRIGNNLSSFGKIMRIAKLADTLEAHRFLTEYAIGAHSKSIVKEMFERVRAETKSLEKDYPAEPWYTWMWEVVFNMDTRGEGNDQNAISCSAGPDVRPNKNTDGIKG